MEKKLILNKTKESFDRTKSDHLVILEIICWFYMKVFLLLQKTDSLF